MRLLISAPAFFPQSFGGGEIYVYHIAKELLKRGHTLKVLTPVKWDKDKKSNDACVIRTHIYDNIPVISLSRNPDKISYVEKITGHGPILIEILRKIITEELPELIHINGMKPAMVTLCNELKIPHVVTAHHTGIVCPAGGLIRYDGTVCKEKINDHNCIPCCCFRKRPKWHVGSLMGGIPKWLYNPLGKRFHGRNKLPYILRGLITPWIVEESMRQKKIVMENAQLIIAPSHFMKDLLVKAGCNPDKIRVIPHGIEPIGAVPVEDIKKRPVRFGYIGRIDPYKGFHIMLKAAELLSEGSLCELHIFGSTRNPWDEEHKQKALRGYKGTPKIIDHGLVPHDRLPEVFTQIDVLVVPSILPEAFGLVVAEAFSAGRPVIVFNSGALQQQVSDGVDGFIVERNDSKALSEAMQKFIDNPDLIFEMLNNIPHVKTIKEYVDEIEELFSIMRL